MGPLKCVISVKLSREDEIAFALINSISGSKDFIINMILMENQ